MFSDDGVNDAFECGEGRSKGGEFPKECLESRYLHRQDFVEGFVLNGPGDDRAQESQDLRPRFGQEVVTFSLLHIKFINQIKGYSGGAITNNSFK